MGLNYPLLFFGASLLAVVIYAIRAVDLKRNIVQTVSVDGTAYSYNQRENYPRTVEGIGLYLKPEPLADISTIQNLANDVRVITSDIGQLPQGNL